MLPIRSGPPTFGAWRPRTRSTSSWSPTGCRSRRRRVRTARPGRARPGGLVSALEPALRSHAAVWIGWSGRHAPEPGDETTAALTPVPEGWAPARCARCRAGRPTSRATTRGSATPRSGRSTTTRSRPRRTTGTRGEPYVRVNRAFADATAQRAARGATVWVHDYQLQLVPAMLRERASGPADRLLPAHPVPAVELFAQLPWRSRSSKACSAPTWSGSTPRAARATSCALAARLGPDARRHRVACPRYGGTASRARSARSRSRSTPRAYDEIARTPRCRSAPRRSATTLGDPERMLLGVDRLDYTKGIDDRLKAFTELLARRAARPARRVWSRSRRRAARTSRTTSGCATRSS